VIRNSLTKNIRIEEQKKVIPCVQKNETFNE